MKNRPAETAGIAVAIGGVIAKIAGVDDPVTITYIVVIVGAVPAIVTAVVERSPRLQSLLGLPKRRASR